VRPVGAVDAVLDAVRESVLAVGVRRTTLSDVARRAGVSRMTIYRSWPDVRTLVGDLMTREWQWITDATMNALGAPPVGRAPASARARLIDSLVTATRTMRGHPLLRKIVDVDPELLLPYLLDRRGASQEYFLSLLAKAISAGQLDGSVRSGDPELLARAILLTTQSYTMSAVTMTDPDGPDLDALDAELGYLLDAYLTPERLPS
jgi:AcrR family transcriptional regulator